MNLDEEHKYQANQLKKGYSSLLSAIIAEEYGHTGKIDDEVCLITNAVIGILYGQSQWDNVEITEQRLSGVLTSFVMCISQMARSDLILFMIPGREEAPLLCGNSQENVFRGGVTEGGRPCPGGR